MMNTIPSAAISPTESIVTYLNEIGEEPLLTFHEEQDLAGKLVAGRQAEQRLKTEEMFTVTERKRLIEAMSAGYAARTQLINSNLRLVVSIARRYQGHSLSLLDLIQEGSLGLMRAVDKFDPSRGLKFSTYATYWIRQSVGRAIADYSRTVRLPVHLGERLSQMARVRQRLIQTLDRDPTYDEVAQELGLTPDQIIRAEQAAMAPYSLDEPYSDESGNILADTLCDSNQLSPLEQISQQLLRNDLHEAMSHLTGREQRILELRYGLHGQHPLTLEQIGKTLSLTRERVRQLENEALKKLRNPLLGQRLHGYLD